MPELTFNVLLIILVGGLSLLGFLFGENRLKVVSYGLFIGFLILQTGSETFIQDLASKTPFDQVTCKFGFVGLICLALFLGAVVSQKKARDKIRSIVLGILSGLFAVSYGLSVVPESTRETLVTDYNLAAYAYNFRFFFMMGLVIWLIVIQFIKDKTSEDDKKK